MPAHPQRRPLRSTLAGGLTVVGVTVVVAAVLFTHVHRVLYNPRIFSRLVADSLEDERVAAFAGDRAAQAIIQHDRDLTPFRPVIRAAAQSVSSSTAFRAIVRTGIARAHQAAMAKGSRSIVLSVPDLSVLVRSALAQANPELATKIPAHIMARIEAEDHPGVQVLLDVWQLGRRLRWLSVGGIALGGACIIGGVLLGRRRSRILFFTGTGFVVAAIVLIMGLPLGRWIVSAQAGDPLLRGLVAGLWDTFTAGIRPLALLLAAIGVILASATRSVFERVELRSQTRNLIDWLGRRPRGAGPQLLRVAILLALGILAMASPAEAIAVTVVLAGAGLAFVALGELFTLILGWLPEEEEVEAALARGGRGWGRIVAVASIAIAIGGGIILISQRSNRSPGTLADRCNGALELCDRPLDHVVFPAAHNAMSSEDIPNWMFPQQEKGVRTQLTDGIRALLIDAHYGRPVGDRVKTDIERERGSEAKYAEAIGDEGVAAAMRIRDRLVGLDEGPLGVYLCHGFCELGATPLVDILHKVHEFLVENPNEIVLMVVEDYVEPEDLLAAFEESGLGELAYRGAVTPPWPTLRDMIEAGERLVVFTESGRSAAPWIHPAFETIQETPYTFRRPEEFSCAPNRGGTSGSLFQINHWIDTAPTPLPKNAAIVNAYDFLLARARQCKEERDHLPNIVAVDFYRTGDLFRVVRTLNGLEEAMPAEP